VHQQRILRARARSESKLRALQAATLGEQELNPAVDEALVQLAHHRE
jgi:hypothetical protein